MNLAGDWLAARAAATPERPAVIFGEQSWDYRELDARVRELAAGLRRAGIRRGSHVAALLPNTPEHILAVHALARLRAVLIPLNTRLTPGEHRSLLEQSDAAVLLFSERTKTQAAEGLSGLRGIRGINLTQPEPWPGGRRGEDDRTEEPSGSADSVQCIMYSSGTTGTPKGVMLTYGNHFAGALASAYHLGTLTSDRWALCLPLYHVGGLAIVWRACLYGITIALEDGFDEERLIQSIRRHGVTMLSLVPTMLARLFDCPGGVGALKALRVILLGGAAAGPALLERSRAAGLPLAPTYGLTEASSQVATALPGEWPARPGSVGRPLPFTRVSILGADGAAAQAGAVGEIAVRGPAVMAGYYGMLKETAEAIQDGWLHTGDLGSLDEQGYLWVAGRRSDLIISGGENIYPADVEAALLEHPAVAEACVVGLEDEHWGQTVGAVVVLKDGCPLAAEELIAHCRARLGGYKVPRLIRAVAELPRTASGKLKRREAARWLEESLEVNG